MLFMEILNLFSMLKLSLFLVEFEADITMVGIKIVKMKNKAEKWSWNSYILLVERKHT